MPSTIIDPSVRVTTMINVFTVRRERQRDLVDLLTRATRHVIRHRPSTPAPTASAWSTTPSGPTWTPSARCSSTPRPRSR